MADTHIKINAVTPRVQYVGDGSTTSFPYAFAIFDDTDMVVYVGDEIIETGYTVTGAGQTEGGNVVFDTAPENGDIITLLRNVPIERVTDFQEGGTFRPKNLNDEFDRQTAFAQQVQEALSRCVKVDPTSETNPEEILPKVERLYESADNIDIVANDKANVDAVAGNATNIDAVAGNESNINTVAGISSDVSTVAGNTTDISNVATNMSDVNDCATNMSAIQDAPNQAASAAASAEAAAQSAAVANPPPLLTHVWSDHLLNDIRYLRADTFSWQDGEVYAAAYNHLEDDYSNGTSQSETIGSYTIDYVLAPDGHKIVQPNMETTVANIYAESGVAWYYVLDRVNDRFKLPRENPVRELLGQSAPVVFGKSIDLSKNSTPFTIANKQVMQRKTANGIYSANYCTDDSGNYTELPNDSTGFVSTDLTRKEGVYKGKKYLYFYVGQFSQSATEQTAGLNSSLFNGKADVDMSNVPSNIGSTAKSYFAGIGMPSTTYEDLTLGASGSSYTAPANGYVQFSRYGANIYNIVCVLKEGETTVSDSAILYRSADTTNFNTSCDTLLLVKKGSKFYVNYGGTATLLYFRFIYAEGEI